MSDKSYRALENALIRQVDHERKHGKVVVAPKPIKPVIRKKPKKPETKVEFY